MFGGGCICPVSQRQHLAPTGSHAFEVVAAGTNYSFLVPAAGLAQEWHINLGETIPFYLDSTSTVFVATSDTAIKKSAWLIRRAAVLEDGVTHRVIEPLHISESDMAADFFTKYLSLSVWKRLVHYVLNKKGELPPRRDGET